MTIRGPSGVAFRPDIEGLRAVAVLLIVAYHAGVPGLTGGFVGVDVFYVLSGYLITLLLVQEIESTGSLDFVAFYSRRARRLLPALVVVVLVTIPMCFVVFAPLEQQDMAKAAMASAGYLSNVYFARQAVDYLGGLAESNPYLHTWSLSVEEQFYLAWPVLILIVLGRAAKGLDGARRRAIGWMAALTVISLAASLVLTRASPPWAFFLAPTRAWEFALGGISALLPATVVGGNNAQWAGVGAIMIAGVAFGDLTPFPGTAALLPVVGTALVLRATAGPPGTVARILSCRPFQHIGRLSYSWYLWHWPILTIATALSSNLPGYAGLAFAGASLIPAEISYRLVENPVRHSRRLAQSRWGSLAMAGAIAGLGIGLAAAWWQVSVRRSADPDQARFSEARVLPDIFNSRCTAGRIDQRVPACTFGVIDAEQTLVLLGDSHAAQWFPPLEEIARARGWSLVLMTKVACPMVDAEHPASRIWLAEVECASWRKWALARIDSIRPLVVIMSSAVTYPIGPGEWLEGTTRVVSALSAASRHVVLLRDTPAPGFHVPACLARREWRHLALPPVSCTFHPQPPRWTAVFRIQQQAVAAFPNARTVDLYDAICPGGQCALEGPESLHYGDESHLTTQFSRSLSPALARELDRAIGLRQ